MNIFQTTFRHIKSKPIYSTISILGFTLGITASLFIYFWVINELNYEKFHPKYQQIYRVLTLSKVGNKIVKSASSYAPIAKTIKKDHPQIENATYISFSSEESPLQIEGKTLKIEARRAWVDSDFFNVFQGFKFIEGNKETAHDQPYKIVLSKKTATILFGSQPALGKTLINDKYNKIVYTVGGVVEIPPQSHMDFGFLLGENTGRGSGYANSWRKSAHTHSYIKLRDNAIIDHDLKQRLSGHINRYKANSDKLVFQPITDIHLYTDYETYQYDKNISHYKYVWIFSGLALLIIIMASLNFASLTTARASERIKEIGVKKVVGSRRSTLIAHFLSETVIQTLIATFLALIAFVLLLPWFKNLSNNAFTLQLSPLLVGSILLLLLLIGMLSGLYPALYLTSFKTISMLKGDRLKGKKAGFKHTLVIIQFAIAILLIIATGTMNKQLNYIENRDLGLEKENIVVIPTGLWYKIEGFKSELLSHPNVLSVSASTQAPVDFGWASSCQWQNNDRQDTVQASMFWVDQDFAKTYDIEIVQGEFLRQNYADYWNEFKKAQKIKNEGKQYKVSLPIVVNESFVKQMNIDNPIGVRVNYNNVIVGVAKDFHYRPLHHEITPMVMLNDPQNISTVSVKIKPENRSKTLTFIQATYKKHRKNRGFSYSYFDDELEQVYLAESRLTNLIQKFSWLALIIAMMGIFGLSTYSSEIRIKEIGIRKVNGAKTSEILKLLNISFVKWISVAFIIAGPIAWYAMHKWLENFAYKTTLSWWIFALAWLMALVISILTVSWQSWRVATRNPVEALRYE